MLNATHKQVEDLLSVGVELVLGEAVSIEILDSDGVPLPVQLLDFVRFSFSGLIEKMSVTMTSTSWN